MNSHVILVEFTESLQVELKFFIFKFASSVIFIEFMISSNNFCQVYDKFKTQFSSSSSSRGFLVFRVRQNRLRAASSSSYP